MSFHSRKVTGRWGRAGFRAPNPNSSSLLAQFVVKLIAESAVVLPALSVA